MALPPFQRVLDEHGPALFRFVASVVGRDAADDCYQEVLIAALRGYPSLKDGSYLRPWLFTVARNKTVDEFRARARRPIPTETLARGASTPGPEPTDDELWGAVDALPTKQRAAVLLRHGADLSYGDVAAVVGGTEDAARRAVSDGLRQLREVLQ